MKPVVPKSVAQNSTRQPERELRAGRRPRLLSVSSIYLLQSRSFQTFLVLGTPSASVIFFFFFMASLEYLTVPLRILNSSVY